MATNGDESWGTALEYSKKVGNFPSMFGTTIRLMMADQVKHRALTPSTKYQVARVLKTAAFTAMLYHATGFLRPDFMQKRKSLSVGQLMAQFSPFDLAALMASYVLHRRAKKLLPEKEWKLISKQVTIESQMGALVGVAFPTVGFGPGALLGSTRRIAIALMSRKDPSKLEKFLKREGDERRWNYDLEQELWGCTGAQVTTFLLTALGFGSELTRTIPGAVSSKTGVGSEKDPVFRAFYVSSLWLDAFAANLAHPEPKPPAAFLPAELDHMRALGLMPAAQTQRSWLDRSKDDYKPETMPEIFNPPAVNEEFEVPKELADIFTIEELTSMEEEEFESLLDHLEGEQKSEKVAEKQELEEAVS